MTTQPRKATQIDAVWCTKQEAAELLRVHPATIDRYCVRGLLTRHSTPGGRTRLKREDVLALIQVREDSAAS